MWIHICSKIFLICLNCLQLYKWNNYCNVPCIELYFMMAHWILNKLCNEDKNVKTKLLHVIMSLSKERKMSKFYFFKSRHAIFIKYQHTFFYRNKCHTTWYLKQFFSWVNICDKLLNFPWPTVNKQDSITIKIYLKDDNI